MTLTFADSCHSEIDEAHDAIGWAVDEESTNLDMFFLAKAQIHATLALVAAQQEANRLAAQRIELIQRSVDLQESSTAEHIEKVSKAAAEMMQKLTVMQAYIDQLGDPDSEIRRAIRETDAADA